MNQFYPYLIGAALLLGACGSDSDRESTQSAVSSIVFQRGGLEQAAMVFDYQQGALRSGEIRDRSATITFTAVTAASGLQEVVFDNGARVSFQRLDEKLQTVEWTSPQTTEVRSLRYDGDRLSGWSDTQAGLRSEVGVVRDGQDRWVGMVESLFDGGGELFGEIRLDFTVDVPGKIDAIDGPFQSAEYQYSDEGYLASVESDGHEYRLFYDDEGLVAVVEVLKEGTRIGSFLIEYVETSVRGPGFPLPLPYGEFFGLDGRAKTEPADWVWPSFDD